jgi:hypothetical protein
MARDFEDIRDLDDLNDDEMRQLVRERIAEHTGLDPDDITVRVEAGQVVLEGRVGTDGERRIAEHVVTDVVGIVDVRNDLVVDPIRRAESPMDIDDHLVAEERTEGLMLGDRPPQREVEDALHADDDAAHDVGTTDLQKAIESGAAWIPPTGPTPEGIRGSDADLGSLGEDH